MRKQFNYGLSVPVNNPKNKSEIGSKTANAEKIVLVEGVIFSGGLSSDEPGDRVLIIISFLLAVYFPAYLKTTEIESF